MGHLNKCLLLLQYSNCNCATTLSIVVVLVNLSLIAACVLNQFDLWTEHLHGHDCRNWGHKIANLELFTEITGVNTCDAFKVYRFFDEIIHTFAATKAIKLKFSLKMITARKAYTSQYIFYFLITFQGTVLKEMFRDCATLYLSSSFLWNQLPSVFHMRFSVCTSLMYSWACLQSVLNDVLKLKTPYSSYQRWL